MNRVNTNDQEGFTLVELILAMTFFGSMLLLATLLLIQTLGIYNKGITVKQMNQVGRTLIEDMMRASNSSSSIETAGNCVNVKGATYLWNVANPAALATDTNQGYKTDFDLYTYTDGTAVNFIKVTDGKKCNHFSSNPTNIPKSIASEMVGPTVRVYAMDIFGLNTQLVGVTMTLGTFDALESPNNLIENAGNFECRSGEGGNYCAKANFETVLYVPNKEIN